MWPRYVPAKPRGFTLVELMVVMAVLAVLATVAAPSFASFMRNAQLTSAANSLVATINAARTEGMKRNLNVLLTPSDGGKVWGKGWIAFVDTDFSGAYSNGDIVIAEQSSPPAYVSIAANGTAAEDSSYIMYDGSGFSKSKNGGFGASTFTFQRTDSDELRHVRRLKIAATGRVRVCTPQSSNDSACTSSD